MAESIIKKPFDVVEQGTFADGRYVKYSNGYAEVFYRHDFGNTAVGGTDATTKISYVIKSNLAFPFAFINIPHVSASCYWGTGIFWANPRDTTKNSTSVNCMKLNSAADSLTISFYAIGRWE